MTFDIMNPWMDQFYSELSGWTNFIPIQPAVSVIGAPLDTIPPVPICRYVGAPNLRKSQNEALDAKDLERVNVDTTVQLSYTFGSIFHSIPARRILFRDRASYILSLAFSRGRRSA